MLFPALSTIVEMFVGPRRHVFFLLHRILLPFVEAWVVMASFGCCIVGNDACGGIESFPPLLMSFDVGLEKKTDGSRHDSRLNTRR